MSNLTISRTLLNAQSNTTTSPSLILTKTRWLSPDIRTVQGSILTRNTPNLHNTNALRAGKQPKSPSNYRWSSSNPSSKSHTKAQPFRTTSSTKILRRSNMKKFKGDWDLRRIKSCQRYMSKWMIWEKLKIDLNSRTSKQGPARTVEARKLPYSGHRQVRKNNT